jgi:hypothetical protein
MIKQAIGSSVLLLALVSGGCRTTDGGDASGARSLDPAAGPACPPALEMYGHVEMREPYGAHMDQGGDVVILERGRYDFRLDLDHDQAAPGDVCYFVGFGMTFTDAKGKKVVMEGPQASVKMNMSGKQEVTVSEFEFATINGADVVVGPSLVMKAAFAEMNDTLMIHRGVLSDDNGKEYGPLELILQQD